WCPSCPNAPRRAEVTGDVTRERAMSVALGCSNMGERWGGVRPPACWGRVSGGKVSGCRDRGALDGVRACADGAARWRRR
ncbi:MAG: hypothetical protein AVDCRST_MAG15-998, partial [uncultured Rubellimicrobium sp.]